MSLTSDTFILDMKPVTAHPAFPYFLLNLGYQFINLVVSIFIGS